MGSGDVWIATVHVLNAPMVHPAKSVIIELAIFRGLSGDDASMSVEKSNHASSTVKLCPKCLFN